MERIKEAFQKVRDDIDYLSKELSKLKAESEENKNFLIEIGSILADLKEEFLYLKEEKNKTQTSTQPTQTSTQPTQTSTQNSPLEALKDLNLNISSGNEGVPTDRQTDRQTDIQHTNSDYEPKKISKNLLHNTIKGESLDSIDNAAKILDSLDNLKKEIRIKFKRLTDQEILVFSTLYQLDEEKGPISYKDIAIKLNLTESSIRDYIGRLIKKGIPIDKVKINNKNICLSISPNLKKIASLPTILQLRDI